MRPTSWTIGILPLALAGTASALPLPFDPASQFSSGFAGQTIRRVRRRPSWCLRPPMRTSSPWSFELQAGGINHQGVTPLAFTNPVIPAARYSASVPVVVTPLAGGLFHALMAPATVLATVEMGPPSISSM